MKTSTRNRAVSLAILLAVMAVGPLASAPASSGAPEPDGPGQSSRITYEYDAQGRLTAVRYGGGLVYRYRYDAASNVVVAEVEE